MIYLRYPNSTPIGLPSSLLLGRPGPPGPQGPAGTGGDLHYVYTQSSSSATWNIAHNLNKYPSVTIIDSAGDYVDGLITYVDANNLTLTFSAAFTGTAYLN
jgi:hypothetical protein